MKSSISHIISFISMIILTAVLCFMMLELNLRHTVIEKNLKSINYYKEAYDNIILKVDNYIINEEIKEKYKEYITFDMVKSDIKKLVNDDSIYHYKDFYYIISNYSNDIEICERYAKEVDNIYMSNIFPSREYNLISKLYIKNTNCLLYLSMMFTGIIILQIVLFIINKSLKYNKIILVSSSILIMIPFIFIKLTGILNNFIYTNSYYTNFIIGSVNYITNYLFILGILVIDIIYIIEFIKKRNK